MTKGTEIVVDIMSDQRSTAAAKVKIEFDEAFTLHHRTVFRTARSVVQDVGLAEDVTQEVFLRVFRSLTRWDSTRPLRPWLLGIAVNRCRTWVGRRAARPELADYLHETPDHRPVDDSTELRTEIRAAVDALRDEYREVFVLFHEQGQSYEEIAEAIGRPVGTVKTWLHRARIEILDRLRTRGLVPDEEHPAPNPKGERP